MKPKQPSRVNKINAPVPYLHINQRKNLKRNQQPYDSILLWELNIIKMWENIKNRTTNKPFQGWAYINML